MALLVAQASAFDLLDAWTDTGGRGRWDRARFGRLARQVAAGPAVTMRDDGALALTIGLYPTPDHAEAWFSAGPALPRVLRPAIRLGRALLDAVGQDAAPQTVKAFIHPDSVAGARLAALFGFSAEGVSESPIGPLATWVRRFP